MNTICTPTTITAGIFTSLVFLDLFRHDYKLTIIHALLGMFFVLLMSILCEMGSHILSWFLLVLPFFILGTFIIVDKYKHHTPRPSNTLYAVPTQGTSRMPYYL